MNDNDKALKKKTKKDDLQYYMFEITEDKFLGFTYNKCVRLIKTNDKPKDLPIMMPKGWTLKMM